MVAGQVKGYWHLIADGVFGVYAAIGLSLALWTLAGAPRGVRSMLQLYHEDVPAPLHH